jgi:hypothetical protein
MLTRLKFAQYRLAFRHGYDTREPIRMPLTIDIDFSQQYEAVPARMSFNPAPNGAVDLRTLYML